VTLSGGGGVDGGSGGDGGDGGGIGGLGPKGGTGGGGGVDGGLTRLRTSHATVEYGSTEPGLILVSLRTYIVSPTLKMLFTRPAYVSGDRYTSRPPQPQ